MYTAALAFLGGNLWRTAALGLLLAGLSAYGVQTWRLHNAQVESAELKVSLEKERADAAEALAAFEAAAREKERHLAEQAAEAERKYLDDLQAAKESADRVAADLRAGNLRLHERWRSCSAAAGVPETGTPAAVPDDRADDRAESASRAIAAAAACDAQVRGLQGLLRAERESMADTQAE